MSERGSFTTEYIYDGEDYESIRKALDHKNKYLCVSPPANWGYGEEPIVSGKVGDLTMNDEWMTVYEALDGVKTNKDVKVVVMCEGGMIALIIKRADGSVEAFSLDERERLW